MKSISSFSPVLKSVCGSSGFGSGRGYGSCSCSCSKIVAKRNKNSHRPSPQGSEPAPPRITTNVKHSLQVLKLWKKRKDGTPKPATRYRRKKVEKEKEDLTEDDSELYLDPTLALYNTDEGIETGLPVMLVDGYNVCGYWAKLKKHFMKGRLEIARDKLIHELVTFSAIREMKVVVVFDATMSGLPPSKETFLGVDIVFPGKICADAWIEKEVTALKEDGCPNVWVVTSDYNHQQAANGSGAYVWSCKALVSEIEEEMEDDIMDEAAEFDLPDDLDMNDDEMAEESTKETKKGDDGLVANKRAACWKQFKVVTPKGHPKPRAACNWCQVSYACHSKNNGTKSMTHHLANLCTLYPKSKKYTGSRQKLLTFEKQEQDNGETSGNLVPITFSVEACKRALAEMIIIDELPFAFVEGEGFKKFLNCRLHLFACKRALAEMTHHKSLKSLFKMHQQNKTNMASKSELEKYLMEASEDDSDRFDILKWWKDNSSKYPILSQVARDVLAIPVSTVASESAFSTSGRVIDPYRSSLAPNTVEALICTQQWIKKPTKINLREQLDELEQLDSVIMDPSGKTKK